MKKVVTVIINDGEWMKHRHNFFVHSRQEVYPFSVAYNGCYMHYDCFDHPGIYYRVCTKWGVRTIEFLSHVRHRLIPLRLKRISFIRGGRVRFSFEVEV